MAQRLLAHLSTVYFDYKRGAKRRGFSWLLTKEEFVSIVSQACFYCGLKPKRRSFNRTIQKRNGRWETFSAKTKERLNGIDRVDGSGGYELKNCVPCCKQCNFLKSNLTLEDFVSHIKKIIKHMEG